MLPVLTPMEVLCALVITILREMDSTVLVVVSMVINSTEMNVVCFLFSLLVVKFNITMS